MSPPSFILSKFSDLSSLAWICPRLRAQTLSKKHLTPLYSDHQITPKPGDHDNKTEREREASERVGFGEPGTLSDGLETGLVDLSQFTDLINPKP